VRERLERKVEPKEEATYSEKEQMIETERKFENTTPWDGAPRNKTEDLSDAAVQRYSAVVKTANDNLKTLARFQDKQEVADQWKTKAQKCRGDLGGFWNDFKHELGCQDVDQTVRLRLNGVLDLLELAERNGGLGTWLEEWNGLLANNPESWDLLAGSIEKINQGIQFCKAMVDAGIPYNRGEDATTRGIREKLHFALDAIASEIARQVDEIYKGNRVDVGKELDAIVERLKEASPRAGIEERLHTAFEATNPFEAPDQKWVSELPEPLKQVVDHAAISEALRTWQDAADDVSMIADKLTDAEIAEEDQMKAADGLNNADTAFARTAIESLTRASGSMGKLDKDVQSIGHYVIQQMGKEMVERQMQLGTSLSSAEARTLLLDGAGVDHVSKLVGVEGLFDKNLNTSYYQAGARLIDGQPGYYWRDFYNQFTLGGQYYDQQTELKLNNELAREPNLFNLLNVWSTQWDMEPGKRYQLTWQLIATLRRYKQIGGAVLRQAGKEEARTFLMTNLDALTDVITEKVKAGVAAGTA
jgi:hypothetical protein